MRMHVRTGVPIYTSGVSGLRGNLELQLEGPGRQDSTNLLRDHPWPRQKPARTYIQPQECLTLT
eukprot:8293142-Pyramimonas_sp.AAC.1